MLSEEEMQRLSFIKYLYTLGIEQSRQAQPHASASILTLHDAVEMFLHLACEHHKANAGKRLEFADYFGLIEKALPGTTVSGKPSMTRLNQVRVGLKHHANLPDKATLTDLASRVGVFFDDNSPVLFGQDFSKISLVNLVQHTEVRASLSAAEQLMRDGSFEESLTKSAIAYTQLMHDFQSRASLTFGASPFAFEQPLRYEYAFPELMSPPPDLSVLPVIKLAGDMQRSLLQVQSALTILSLGLDYPRFARFQHLTPVVWKALDRDDFMTDGYGDVSHTIEDCQFCCDFVIQCALKLQELDAKAT